MASLSACDGAACSSPPSLAFFPSSAFIFPSNSHPHCHKPLLFDHAASSAGARRALVASCGASDEAVLSSLSHRARCFAESKSALCSGPTCLLGMSGTDVSCRHTPVAGHLAVGSWHQRDPSRQALNSEGTRLFAAELQRLLLSVKNLGSSILHSIRGRGGL